MSEERHPNGNGWDKYKQLILSDRQAMRSDRKATAEYREAFRNDTEKFRSEMRVENNQLRRYIAETLMPEISDIKSEISALQVKAGVWGLGGGIVAALTAIGLWLVQQARVAPH